MMVTADQWDRVRDSVPAVLRRLLALVDGVPPDRAVTAHWTVADTLAHLVSVATIDVALVRDAAPDLPGRPLGDLLTATTVDTVADMNRRILADFTERDVPTLAARLRSDVDELLAATSEVGPLPEVSWLGGARLPMAGLLAHLLNELNIHAWDIARATGARWEIDPRDAALFFDLFLVGVVRCGYGRLVDHDGPVRRGRLSVTFRSTVSPAVTFALTDGLVTVEEPDPRPDVRVSYDPATFGLMLFGRVSRVRAVLAGKLSVGGRRPWLLPTFMATMRMPS
ncbi:maleylpyruvate isomerase N-terminal domain-containing protein [Polymorphospora sp. NPDC050346]|uniref:maleylpyruvate isomerase N-terminal domain-containing protein n=1 Tax=Polymorphospora sp. NPDC050346 TaxID=3155780 RepID=UPI0033F43F29